MKGAANKHRIKSRKTRLMVDIYKTAPYCTVEELDKRDGTSWSTNSNFAKQELELQAEDIKEKSAFIHEVAGNEGDVYIDTNGKKVRILSVPNLSTLDESEGRKLKKQRKGSKVIMEKNNGRKLSTLGPNKRKVSEKKTKETSKKEDVTITRRPPSDCSKQTELEKKRFPVLTKPNDGLRLDDSCEDSSSIRSKESNKFSYIKNEMLLERREHNAGSNLKLKRKFSALKKSRDQSNDSLKDKSIVEEDKKKNFVTSNSLNEDSSSRGLEITSESTDQVGIEGSFMSLRNLLYNEYYKFDSHDENLANITTRLNTGDCMNDTGIQRSYIEDLDPIPIPGPPGSFLPPSPGADTVYEEELQGNSSLTNTSYKVQSSDHQDYHHDDLMNTDVISDSPMSNVSNPSFARSSDISPTQLTSDLRPVGTIFSKEVGSYHQASRKQALESYGGMNMIKPLADASIKFPVYKDSESAISPTSVIRLMGKNLTVVRTDDDPPCSSYQQLHNIPNYDQSSFLYGNLQNSDDPFEDKARSDHMFKEQSMPMQQSSHNLSNSHGGRFSSAFQEGSSVQTSSTYYPRAFS